MLQNKNETHKKKSQNTRILNATIIILHESNCKFSHSAAVLHFLFEWYVNRTKSVFFSRVE